MLHLAIWAVLDQLKGPKDKGGLRFRQLDAKKNENSQTKKGFNIQLFRERLSEKIWTRQSRKVIWDMINTLFPDAVAVEPTFVAFL